MLNYAFLALVGVAALVSHFTGHDFLTPFVMFGAVVAPQTPASQTSNLNTVAANFIEYIDKESGPYYAIWENNPFLTLISKDDGVIGNYYDKTIVYGTTAGTTLGNGYQNSLGNQSPQQQATFHVPMSELWHIGTIDGRAIEAAKNTKGAFEPLVETHFTNGMKICANKLSLAVLGSGTASIGQIATITVNPSGYPAGSAQVTLTNSVSYRAFEYQMVCDVTTTDGGAPLGAPATVQVIGVDAGAGVLVFAAPTSGSWGSGNFIVGKYLIQDGDYSSTSFGQTISTATGVTPFNPQAVAGVGAWVPSPEFRASPGLAANNFLNVPRQLNGTRLAGLSFQGGTMAIAQALSGGSIQAATFGDDKVGPAYAFMGPTSYLALMNSLQGQKLYEDEPANEDASIIYKNVYVHQGGAKRMKVIMDPSMPPKRAYLCSADDFMLVSTNGVPKPMPFGNGDAVLPLPTQNGVQFRVGGFTNLVCMKPGNVVNVTLQQ